MNENLDVLVRNIGNDTQSISEKALAEAVKVLIKEFTLAKDFSKNQIKAMSLLSINSIMKDIIKDWIDNMKHHKGNYRKSCEALIKIAFEGLANITKVEKEGFLHNLFNRCK